MPKATRKTKTNSGSDASAPPNPSTWSNTSALMPSAAPNDSTTVATSSTGASNARSNSARISSTTRQHDRDDHLVVVIGGSLRVQQDRGSAAGQRVRVRHRVHCGPDPVDGVLGGLGVRRRPSSSLRGRPGRRRPAVRRPRRCPASRPSPYGPLRPCPRCSPRPAGCPRRPGSARPGPSRRPRSPAYR